MTLKEILQITGPTKAFQTGDQFAILNENGKPIQGEYSQSRADSVCCTLNAHELSCGRTASYTVTTIEQEKSQ